MVKPYQRETIASDLLTGLCAEYRRIALLRDSALLTVGCTSPGVLMGKLTFLSYGGSDFEF